MITPTMCGICGKVYVDQHRAVLPQDLESMMQAISHRGPDSDGSGVWGNVGFGHRRLAIIDLSPAGHQPMSYADGRLWITFNGEIFNYLELKKSLERQGYHFVSQSDTEVILALYHRYGEASVKRLRGQFAFVIYDRLTGTIFAARDRLGKNPFKYYFNGKVFLFASEVKAILTQPEVSVMVDDEAIKEYLYWGFVPAPKTGFLGVQKLPPAHTLTLKQGKLTIKRYWNLQPIHNTTRTEVETINEVRATVSDAITKHMISDVTLGSFLSGGIDSTIITGVMAHATKQPVKTFTVGFEGWENDESGLAAETARFHRTDHTLLPVTMDIESSLPEFLAAYDEPFGDVSALPSLLVSKAARKHVSVALNGDGGDENFIGYSNYTSFADTQFLRSWVPLFKLGNAALEPLRPMLSSLGLYQRLLRVSDILKRPPNQAYWTYARGYLNLMAQDDLYQQQPYDASQAVKKYLPRASSDPLSALLYHDLQNVLPEGLMTKADTASMRFGLEGRSPFMDHHVVELAASIPTKLKYHRGTTKYVLRKAFEDMIPDRIMKEPKRGFVIPIDMWFKSKVGLELVRELATTSARINAYIDRRHLDQLITWHQRGTFDYSPFLWRFLTLELWLRYYAM